MEKTTGFTSMKGVDPTGAFNRSFFGVIRPGETYRDGFNGIDRLPDLDAILKDNLRKMELKYSGVGSAVAGGAGTAGVAMVPVYVSPLLTDRSRKLTPWVEMTSRVANMGITHEFNVITSKDSASWEAEDAAQSDQDYTPDRISVPMKYLYAVGRVTGQAQAAYPPYMYDGYATITGPGLGANPFGSASAPNAMQLEVLVRTRTLKETEEESFWNGSISDDANEFDGIIQLQGSENTVDKNTSALTYDDIETAMKNAYDDSGFPNVAGASSGVMQDLRKIAFDAYRFRPGDQTTELPFGVTSRLTLETTAGAVPVVPSQFLSNVSGSKAIYFLDMTEIYMAILQDATYEKLAKTNDSEKFFVKLYEALAMRAPTFNSSVTEISG